LIDVAIGTGSKTKTFQAPKASLYRQSTYFSKKECTGIIVLEDLDPVSFALFCQWVHKPAKPIEYRAEGYGGVMQKCLPEKRNSVTFAVICDLAAGYPVLGPRVGYSRLKAPKASLEQDKIGL
jgi:hypothetical protein